MSSVQVAGRRLCRRLAGGASSGSEQVALPLRGRSQAVRALCSSGGGSCENRHRKRPISAFTRSCGSNGSARTLASASNAEDQSYLRYIHRAKAKEEDDTNETAGAAAAAGDAAAAQEGAAAAGDDSEGESPQSNEYDTRSTMHVLKSLKAGDVLRQKQLLRQQIEVPGSTTVDEAITAMVNERVASFMVVDAAGKVIGLFTARDVLGVLARFPNKADGLAARVHEFMIPLSQMITCSPEDSLYQCLLVMTELRIRNLPVLADGQVGGIINSNDISDFTFSSEQLGGKKAYINNISERKGLREGVSINSPRELLSRQHIHASIGAAALPHPFKRPGHVSPSARDHRHRELCMDPTLSEDAHFVLSVAWATPEAESLQYVGIADGVGSWRGLGVDPREFPQRLMFWAQQYILSTAPSVSGSAVVDQPRPAPKPLEVLSAAWEMVMGEKAVGSSTACIATLDYSLDQLTFSNIGDNGVVVLRHIDSDIAGYMRERRTPRHLRTSDLRIAFISQQQLRSFNLPYQLGYTNVPAGGTFETPRDAVNTSFPIMPGDIVILATDGLYDNMELDEMCDIAQEWETKWFGGAMRGLDKQDNAAAADLAARLAQRARELSLDTSRDSPFALLAKENDIMWGGGMPDDVTVVVMRIVNKLSSKFQFAQDIPPPIGRALGPLPGQNSI